MTSKRRKLWATSAIRSHPIRIYLNSKLVGYDGVCTDRRDGTIIIDIRAGLLDQPAKFDETLIHEVCHAVETVYFPKSTTAFGNGQYGPGKDCCKAVQALGEGLNQFFRELVQVGGRRRKRGEGSLLRI